MTNIKNAIAAACNTTTKNIRTHNRPNCVEVTCLNVFESEKITRENIAKAFESLGMRVPEFINIGADYTGMYVPPIYKDLYNTIQTAANNTEIKTTAGTIWKDGRHFCLRGKFYAINDNAPAILVKLEARPLV